MGLLLELDTEAGVSIEWKLLSVRISQETYSH